MSGALTTSASTIQASIAASSVTVNDNVGILTDNQSPQTTKAQEYVLAGNSTTVTTGVGSAKPTENGTVSSGAANHSSAVDVASNAAQQAGIAPFVVALIAPAFLLL